MRPWVEKSASGPAVEGATGMLISIFMPPTLWRRRIEPAPVRGDGIGKKRIHSVQDFSGGAGRVNVPAQFAAVTNSVGKPARKLFHLADRVGPLSLHQIAEVRGEQSISI